MSGKIGDHYKVERELGQGGMATVYLCTDERTGEHVAVKVLKAELGSPVVIERFLREIKFCWGNNSDGEVGDGTTLNHNIPIRIAGQ